MSADNERRARELLSAMESAIDNPMSSMLKLSLGSWCESLRTIVDALQEAPTGSVGREAVGVVNGPDRGGSISQNATLLRPMRAGTKLYTAPQPSAPVVDDAMVERAWQAFLDKERSFLCVDKERKRECMRAALTAALAQPQGQQATYQGRVVDWMKQCFAPELYGDLTERCDRFMEEAIEQVQALGYDRARIDTLANYVYGRPAGDPAQETGGVMVTLAGLCWRAGIDMHASAEAELSRITQPEVMTRIRAKQQTKNALHFDTPLSGPSHSQGREAVDLEQFREAVENWRDQYRLRNIHLPVSARVEVVAKANRLLALIDAQSAKGDGDA